MIRVLLIDDQPAERYFMGAWIVPSSGMELVAEGADGDEALELYKQHKPDVVVLDLHLVKISGLGAARLIKQFDKNAKILIRSSYVNYDILDEVNSIGAGGFLVKTGNPGLIVDAIKAIYNYGVFYCPKSTELIINKKADNSFLMPLTGIQRTITMMLIFRMAPEMIANILNREETTVYTHRRNIFNKLGISSLGDLYKLATDAGFYTPYRVEPDSSDHDDPGANDDLADAA